MMKKVINGKAFNIHYDTDFRHQDLRNADFAGMHLSHANFMWADLRGANFRDASLECADFRFARMDKFTVFTGADMAYADTSQIEWETISPDPSEHEMADSNTQALERRIAELEQVLGVTRHRVSTVINNLERLSNWRVKVSLEYLKEAHNLIKEALND